jgi:hypothetical protein
MVALDEGSQRSVASTARAQASAAVARSKHIHTHVPRVQHSPNSRLAVARDTNHSGHASVAWLAM